MAGSHFVCSSSGFSGQTQRAIITAADHESFGLAWLNQSPPTCRTLWQSILSAPHQEVGHPSFKKSAVTIILRSRGGEPLLALLRRRASSEAAGPQQREALGSTLP